MSTRTSLLLLLCSATLVACFPQPPDYDDGPETPRNFSRDTFESQVLPALNSGGCLGCHSAAAAMGGFGLYADPADSAQRDQNFNRVVALVSTSVTADTATTARIYVKATVSHSNSTPLANAIVLENWIRVGLGGQPVAGGPDAGPAPDGGGGGNTDAFDADVFERDIQEIFDDNGCTNNCHDANTRLGNFGLTPMAFPGSPEMDANRLAVIGKIDTSLAPANATQAKIYVKATTAHSGSTEVTNSSQLTALEGWITVGLMGQ